MPSSTNQKLVINVGLEKPESGYSCDAIGSDYAMPMRMKNAESDEACSKHGEAAILFDSQLSSSSQYSVNLKLINSALVHFFDFCPYLHYT